MTAMKVHGDLDVPMAGTGKVLRRELLLKGQAILLRAGVAEACEETEKVLEEFLSVTRAELYLDLDREVPEAAAERFLTILKGREKRVPLAYLLKKADFWRETLHVDERCLIPRPETEILVEVAIKEAKQSEKIRRAGLNLPDKAVSSPPFSFLDIGTGSGAVAIALLREFPGARGTLLDVSAGALEVARMNLERYRLLDRATLVEGDIFLWGARDSGLGTRPGSSALRAAKRSAPRGTSPEKLVPVFDLIVSNPPYLSKSDLVGLQPELEFEPRMALDGGEDGLDFYREIIPLAREPLTPGGFLAFEVGIGQAEQVSKWLQDAGYVNIQRFKDHLHIERVIIAKKP